MADIEKTGATRLSVEHKEHASVGPAVAEGEILVATELNVVELSHEEKRKVLRKLDWILVPQLALFYLLAFLDRGNSTRTHAAENINI